MLSTVSQQYGHQKTTNALSEAITALSFRRKHEIEFKLVLEKQVIFTILNRKRTFVEFYQSRPKRISSL